jgi:putative NADPH-quinone reductase
MNSGFEVRVVNLINTIFNEGANAKDFLKVPENSRINLPVLQSRDNLKPEIIEQQENLLWATHVIVFGPMFFFRFPSSLYSYIDKVLTAGWAYDFAGKLAINQLPLYQKKILFAVTTGAPGQRYTHGNGLTSLDGLLYPTTSSFAYVGFSVYRSQGLFGAGRVSKEELVIQAKKFAKAMLNIEKRPLLPFGQKKPAGKDEIEIFIGLPNLTLDECISSK